MTSFLLSIAPCQMKHFVSQYVGGQAAAHRHAYFPGHIRTKRSKSKQSRWFWTFTGKNWDSLEWNSTCLRIGPLPTFLSYFPWISSFFFHFFCLFDDFLIHIQHNSSKLKPWVHLFVSPQRHKNVRFYVDNKASHFERQSSRPTTIKL